LFHPWAICPALLLSKTMKVTNWMVRVYDNNDQVIDSWCINERTEAEAVKEAESDPIVLNNDSWTLMEDKELNKEA